MCVNVFSCFVFKQKTAYDVRISDWSSDVCSSDLQDARTAFQPSLHPMAPVPHISSGPKDREPILIWTFRRAFPRQGGAFLDIWLIGRCRVAVPLLLARYSLRPV